MAIAHITIVFWPLHATASLTSHWLKNGCYVASEELKYVEIRACLQGGGGPQIGEVTWGGSPHLTCNRDQIKMRL